MFVSGLAHVMVIEARKLKAQGQQADAASLRQKFFFPRKPCSPCRLPTGGTGLGHRRTVSVAAFFRVHWVWEVITSALTFMQRLDHVRTLAGSLARRTQNTTATHPQQLGTCACFSDPNPASR